MSLTFLLGGARSGKSALAVELARGWGGAVTVIATAEARDDEMSRRIRLHQAEEPFELESALSGVSAASAVVLDCLSLWVANLLERGLADAEVEEQSNNAVVLAQNRGPLTIVVSNEVGLGVVPPSELGRRYRDLLGRVNAQWAAAADEAAFVLAGRRLRLQ